MGSTLTHSKTSVVPIKENFINVDQINDFPYPSLDISHKV